MNCPNCNMADFKDKATNDGMQYLSNEIGVVLDEIGDFVGVERYEVNIIIRFECPECHAVYHADIGVPWDVLIEDLNHLGYIDEFQEGG